MNVESLSAINGMRIEHMRRRLEADDLEGFLAAYEQYALTAVFEPAAIPLTQVALPGVDLFSLSKVTVGDRALA